MLQCLRTCVNLGAPWITHVCSFKNPNAIYYCKEVLFCKHCKFPVLCYARRQYGMDLFHLSNMRLCSWQKLNNGEMSRPITLCNICSFHLSDVCSFIV